MCLVYLYINAREQAIKKLHNPNNSLTSNEAVFVSRELHHMHHTISFPAHQSCTSRNSKSVNEWARLLRVEHLSYIVVDQHLWKSNYDFLSHSRGEDISRKSSSNHFDKIGNLSKIQFCEQRPNVSRHCEQ